MYLYPAIMLPAAAALWYIASRIFRGEIKLVMNHHTERVTDKKRYCKALGMSLFIIGAGIAASGICGLFGDSRIIFILSMTALTAGIMTGITGIIIAQIKYNGGIF